MSCVFPTDNADELSVQIDEDALQLVVGERVTLHPRLVDASGREISGARFSFQSEAESVARADNEGVILGTSPGAARVVVNALSYDQAAPDSLTVLVIDNVAIDHVSPVAVRFGETLTVVGTALNPAAAALIAVGGVPAPVTDYRPADIGNPGARDTLWLVTPTGASANSDLVILRPGGGSATAAIEVEQVDIFEPNDVAPFRMPDFSVANPQLAFEAGLGPPVDWYRFGTVNGSVTLELVLGIAPEWGLGQAVVHSPTGTRGEPPQWSISARVDEAYCHGLLARQVERFLRIGTDVSELPIFFPLMDVSLDSIDLSVEMYSALLEPRTYRLFVHEGYISFFPPDVYEENDFCDLAPLIEDGFVGTLSIDNHHDVDWFRIQVDAPSILDVEITCITCAIDGGDIDLTLYEDVLSGPPEAPNVLPIITTAETFTSSTETMSVSVDPGSYFLLVQNVFYTPVETLELSVSISPQMVAAAPATR